MIKINLIGQEATLEAIRVGTKPPYMLILFLNSRLEHLCASSSGMCSLNWYGEVEGDRCFWMLVLAITEVRVVGH